MISRAPCSNLPFAYVSPQTCRIIMASNTPEGYLIDVAAKVKTLLGDTFTDEERRPAIVLQVVSWWASLLSLVLKPLYQSQAVEFVNKYITAGFPLPLPDLLRSAYLELTAADTEDRAIDWRSIMEDDPRVRIPKQAEVVKEEESAPECVFYRLPIHEYVD
jgi:hypothetical protein